MAIDTSGIQKPHFVLLPWLTMSHMLPMIDIGRLLAERGVTVSVLTTPANAARIQPTIDRFAESGLPIRFVPLRFPSVEVGLPEGCESIDTLPQLSLFVNLYAGSKLLRTPMARHLREPTLSPPTCFIVGACFSWAPELAREFGVSCFIFHGFGAFALFCMHNVHTYKPYEAVSSPEEPFVLPGLPFEFKLTTKQLPLQFKPPFLDMIKETREGELVMDGIVVNSFDDFEPGYPQRLANASGKKVFTVGPVSQSNRSRPDMAERGDKAQEDIASRCLSWLDSMKPKSVIYVSFGSFASFSSSQLTELGSGLLASGNPFIWVIKNQESLSEEVKQWLRDEFEDRDDSRCLLVRNWAPQVLILSHPAIGGFVTHCGWNSTMESLSAGVPLVTWPLFAEQFMNQKLLVDVLGIGVAIGEETSMEWRQAADDATLFVTRKKVAEAVEKVMDGGEEGKERRRRAEELGEKARKALEKGGSSFDNMTLLINFVTNKASHCA